MKVLIDLTSLADNFSGIERYAACLAKEMIQDTSIEYILVFKETVHDIFKEDVDRNNVETVVLKRCNKLLFNQVRLPNAIRKIKADYYLFLAFPAPIFLFKRNMISTIHDICCWDCPETMNGMSKWYFRISHLVALKKCKAIITISEFSKNRIVDRLHYDQSKIWLIYCGVDEKFIDFKSDPEKEKAVKEKYNLPNEYILSLSTLEPRKNLPLLIKAYSSLVDEGDNLPPLVLAGRKGWKMEQLLASINENVKERIIFTGFIDDEDLPYVYALSSFFVFPSKYEGFGMPPLEALACGAKVLSSDSSSLPEVLGEEADYFKNNDLKDLIRKVNAIYRRGKKINHVFNIYRFSWEKQAKRLADYLRN